MFGELGIIETENAKRIFNRFPYYEKQKDVKHETAFYTKIAFKEFMESKFTNYEKVASAKIGPKLLSTVFKGHTKESDKDLLVVVEDFTDHVEMTSTFVTIFDGDLDPELVAYKAI